MLLLQAIQPQAPEKGQRGGCGVPHGLSHHTCWEPTHGLELAGCPQSSHLLMAKPSGSRSATNLAQVLAFVLRAQI